MYGMTTSAALNGYHSPIMLRQPIRTAAISLVLAGFFLGTAAYADSAGDRRRAFDLAYNLDHDDAVTLLRKAVVSDPDNPANHRALATVLWLNLLFQRGAVTVDHYLGSFSRTQVELSKPPPDLDAEFRNHVERAIRLAEARMAASPGNAQARYDLGAAVGLQASHIATVQGKMFAGFKAARRAYDEHEKVLALDASSKDAGLIVGTYRYIVSTLSLPLRMMAYVVGFGGGRERGLLMLEDTARAGQEARTDAMFALVLMYNRERRYDDALRVLADLRRTYPRNRLVILEAGSTALRAQQAARADELLSEGLAILKNEKRPLMPGEEALWRYKRGAARVMMNQAAAAKADLDVATGPSAQEWVSGRAHTQLAQLAIRRNDQAAARELLSRAESLCQRGNDAPCVSQARHMAENLRGR